MKHLLLKSLGKKPRKGAVQTCPCGKITYVRPCRVKKINYCSRFCANKALLTGRTLNCKWCNEKYYTNLGQIKWRGSSFCSYLCHWTWRSKNIHSERSPMWKGEKATYHPIHAWVKKHKGRPEQCINCGKKHSGKQGSIHWANIDHKYKRKLEDFIPLCPKCHDAYDRKYNNKHVSSKKGK